MYSRVESAIAPVDCKELVSVPSGVMVEGRNTKRATDQLHDQGADDRKRKSLLFDLTGVTYDLGATPTTKAT